MPIFLTAFLRARGGRKWGKRTLENGKGTRKHFLCPLAIFQCPLAPFSAVSCLQEGCDNRTVENSTTRGKVRWGSVIFFPIFFIVNDQAIIGHNNSYWCLMLEKILWKWYIFELFFFPPKKSTYFHENKKNPTNIW